MITGMASGGWRSPRPQRTIPGLIRITVAAAVVTEMNAYNSQAYPVDASGNPVGILVLDALFVGEGATSTTFRTGCRIRSTSIMEIADKPNVCRAGRPDLDSRQHDWHRFVGNEQQQLAAELHDRRHDHPGPCITQLHE